MQKEVKIDLWADVVAPLDDTRFKHIIHIAMFSKHNYHGISNASNRNDPKAINGYHKGLEDHLEVKMISQPRQNRRFF